MFGYLPAPCCVLEQYKYHVIGKATMCASISASIKLSEVTVLRGFRPGLTQTDLYSHRSRLEA